MKKNSILIVALFVCLLLMAWSWVGLPYGEWPRILGGSVLVLLLPGMIWSYWWMEGAKTVFTERAIWAVIFSIALLTPLFYLANILFGMALSERNIILVILGICVSGIWVNRNRSD